jgi:hypothetical protein
MDGPHHRVPIFVAATQPERFRVGEVSGVHSFDLKIGVPDESVDLAAVELTCATEHH